MSHLICHTMLCNWIFNTCTNNIIIHVWQNYQKLDINTHLFNILRIINIIIVVVVIIIIVCLKYKLNLG